MSDRLRQSVTTLVDVGAVEPSAVDEVVNRVSAHDDLDTALAPCAAVMESIVEDAQAKADCYRDISNALYPELAADRTASKTIEQHVADGRLGVKSGRGFYEDDDERVAELTNRLYRIALELQGDPA